jgi:DNA uptake protein ComE-like DNA-binding protein
VNHAAVDDLLVLPGMTLSNSQKLVRERDARGGFRTIEEAGHFLKLQPHVVVRLKERSLAKPYGARRPSTGRLIDY